MIASTHSIANATNRIMQIIKSEDKQETAFLTYHNVSIRFQGHDPYNQAVALLRAGGVEIPDGSENPNPDPER